MASGVIKTSDMPVKSVTINGVTLWKMDKLVVCTGIWNATAQASTSNYIPSEYRPLVNVRGVASNAVTVTAITAYTNGLLYCNDTTMTTAYVNMSWVVA